MLMGWGGEVDKSPSKPQKIPPELWSGSSEREYVAAFKFKRNIKKWNKGLKLSKTKWVIAVRHKLWGVTPFDIKTLFHLLLNYSVTEIPPNWIKLLDIIIFLFKIAHLWKTISSLFLHIDEPLNMGLLLLLLRMWRQRGHLQTRDCLLHITTPAIYWLIVAIDAKQNLTPLISTVCCRTKCQEAAVKCWTTSFPFLPTVLLRAP